MIVPVSIEEVEAKQILNKLFFVSCNTTRHAVNYDAECSNIVIVHIQKDRNKHLNYWSGNQTADSNVCLCDEIWVLRARR